MSSEMIVPFGIHSTKKFSASHVRKYYFLLCLLSKGFQALMTHNPKQYINQRGKKYITKLCMLCGKEYQGFPSGVVNSHKMERGVCPQCKNNDALWHYHGEDYGVCRHEQ